MNLDDLRRQYFEDRLARAVSWRFGKERREIIELLGDPPDISRITEDFWLTTTRQTETVLRPIMEDVAMESGLAAQQAAAGNMIISWELIHQDAAIWARDYAFDLVKGIEQTTRNFLKDKISTSFREGWTRGDLVREIGGIYSPVRSEMIAVTEVTRANVEGERRVIERIRETTGINMRPIWQTDRDGLVCIVCAPRNDKEITDGMYPPAHPRCRCWVNHEFVEDAQ